LPTGAGNVRTGEVEPGARYPRVVARKGKAPPQYPDPDEEGDWDEDPPSALALSQFAAVELAPLPELQEAAAAAPTVVRLRALVLSGTETFALAWVVLLAFIRLTTSPRVFDSPLTTPEAMGLVDGWLAQPCATVVHPTPGIHRCCVDCSSRSGRPAI
jgi:hypothetical protein